jgi:tetratricopeptide (TPR) repeat protein
VQTHWQLKERDRGVAVCREGLQRYPDDAELLFQQGMLLREAKDWAGAEASLQRLLQTKPGEYFDLVDIRVRTYQARRQLAEVCQAQGRPAEAEAHWRAALADNPDFLPALRALGDILLHKKAWGELDGVVAKLEALVPDSVDTVFLMARACLGRGEFAEARRLFEAVIARVPEAVQPRVLLTHALIRAENDWPATEKALRAVLACDPGQDESRKNLGVLLRRRERAEEVAQIDARILADRYELAVTTPSDVSEHCPTLYALAKECRHVTEFGTRTAVSTTALLHAQPDKLVCYDKVTCPQVEVLRRLAGRTEFVFHQADVLKVEIEPTDLLFIDTLHTYAQLREEFRLHGPRVRKYIVVHDTTTYGEKGEDDEKGLWPAIEELLALRVFRVKQRYENNNGLTVLERVK